MIYGGLGTKNPWDSSMHLGIPGVFLLQDVFNCELARRLEPDQGFKALPFPDYGPGLLQAQHLGVCVLVTAPSALVKGHVHYGLEDQESRYGFSLLGLNPYILVSVRVVESQHRVGQLAHCEVESLAFKLFALLVFRVSSPPLLQDCNQIPAVCLDA